MEFLKNIAAICFLFIILSCNKFPLKGSCENDMKLIKELECLQIFEKLPVLESYKMESEGTHLITGEKCICEDRWYNRYKDQLEKGDTIIKRKGELSFSIHKKDTVIVVKWECEGKVYE